jgi:hypothetical protein
MTGITAEPAALTAVADRAALTAGRLAAGTDPGEGPPVFALPQASRFLTALTAARTRQAAAANDFARFYADAGASLTTLAGALTRQEDAAADSFSTFTGGPS